MSIFAVGEVAVSAGVSKPGTNVFNLCVNNHNLASPPRRGSPIYRSGRVARTRQHSHTITVSSLDRFSILPPRCFFSKKLMAETVRKDT